MSLAEYIRQLIDDDQLVKFYKSQGWRLLREEVLREHYYECQECMKQGKYTRATMVHHVQEVRKRPDLAMSKTYVDGKGNVHKQLVPLCIACHEKEHDKLGGYVRERSKDKFTNEERW